MQYKKTPFIVESKLCQAFSLHSTKFKIASYAINTLGHNQLTIAIKIAISGPSQGYQKLSKYLTRLTAPVCTGEGERFLRVLLMVLEVGAGLGLLGTTGDGAATDAVLNGVVLFCLTLGNSDAEILFSNFDLNRLTEPV